MSQSTENTDPEMGLRDLEDARQEFDQAVARVPDEALPFRPEGDDYALSGLVIHVASSFEHYSRVLGQFQRNAFGPSAVEEDAAMLERVRQQTHDGFTGAERIDSLRALAAAHLGLVERVRGLGIENYHRQALVVYGEGQEPYPTAPADVVKWMADHYREHVPHVAELVEAWRNSR